MSLSDLTSHTTLSKKLKYIVITHGDSYLGQTLAMHIADQLDKGQGQLKKKYRAVRILCQDKAKLKHLENRGIEVKQVDYESQHTIAEQLKVHIKTMIYNPFAATMGRMVECGVNVLDAAIRQDVKRVVMVSSSYGVDTMTTFSAVDTPLAQFKMLEAHLRHHYKYGSWVVYRIPCIQQYMYFWTQMLENKNILGMPISEGDMLMTVNIKDVHECVAIASLSKKSMVWAYREPERHLEASTILPGGPDGDTSSSSDDSSNQQPVAIKRVYELVSEPLTLVMMADAISRALGEAGGSFTVDAAVLTDEQVETYLKLVAKTKQSSAATIDAYEWTCILSTAKILEPSSYQQGASELLQSRSSLVTTKSRDHQDSPDVYPCPADTLTPFCIQLIMNHFKVARNMMMPPLGPSHDIRDIIGRSAIPIDVFFMLNRKLFHPQ
ncbi:hypothetical protein MAM1_0058d03712 [Mucor ambiguus]|uniref:NAD(P)-binding domain-containing protein n=1 Tax=Mucor ambiguus TaxID=91626 RepID=A0A0C9MMB1_9FUNG|nr:hypothetical protein MAM1_0058d03712 [Mucor ambiguus]